MASSPVQMLKSFWNSQVMDEEQRTLNLRVLKATGVFAASVFLIRNLNFEYFMEQ